VEKEKGGAMNKWKFACILIFIILIAGFTHYFFKPGQSGDWDKAGLQRIQEENKQLKAANRKLQSQMEDLLKSRDSLTVLIGESSHKRIKLEENRDEEINRIDGLDKLELYRFFTNFKTKVNQSGD